MKALWIVLLPLLGVACSEPGDSGDTSAPEPADTDSTDDTDPPDDTDEPDPVDCTLSDAIAVEEVTTLAVQGWSLDFDAHGRLVTVDRSSGSPMDLVAVGMDGTGQIVAPDWYYVDDARVLTNGRMLVVRDDGYTVIDAATGSTHVSVKSPLDQDAAFDVGADDWFYAAAEDGRVVRIDSVKETEQELAAAGWTAAHGTLHPVDVALTERGDMLYVLTSPDLHDAGPEHGLWLFAMRRKVDGTWNAPSLVWKAPEASLVAKNGLTVDRCGNAFVLTAKDQGPTSLWRVPANLTPAELVVDVPHTLHSIRWGSGIAGWSKDALFALGDGLYVFDLGVEGTHVLAR